MYCPNCGKDNPTGAPNCHFCNAPMVGAMRPPRKSSTSTIVIIAIVVCFVGLFVVAILGAILFPVFARARESARASSCVSNMKEMAVAMQMYAADYNSSLPPASNWCDSIQPKLQNQQAFVCPAVSELKCGYGLNANVGSLNNVQAPTHLVLLFESDGGWNANGSSEKMIAAPRHGCYNVIYADGHFGRVFPNYLSVLEWTRK